MNTNTKQGFLSVLARSAGFALQWRLLLLWIVVLLIPTAILTLPIWHLIGAQLDHSALAGGLAHQLTVNALNDIGYSLYTSQTTLHAAGLIAVVLTLLLAPFLNGAIVTAARAQVALGFGKLVHGGISEYWRMFRTLIVSLIPIAIAGGISAGVAHWSDGVAEKAILESAAQSAGHVSTIVSIIVLLLATATIEAGRAQFVHSMHRRSALRAWWNGVKLVFKHPLSAFGQFVLLTLIGLLLIAVFGYLRINVGHVSRVGFVVGFILTQLLVASICWMKVARLYALASVSK